MTIATADSLRSFGENVKAAQRLMGEHFADMIDTVRECDGLRAALEATQAELQRAESDLRNAAIRVATLEKRNQELLEKNTEQAHVIRDSIGRLQNLTRAAEPKIMSDESRGPLGLD